MPWCPKCKTEYVEGVTVCADCNTPLVDNFSEEMEDNASFEEIMFSEENAEEIQAQKEAYKEAIERQKQMAKGHGVFVESSKKAEEFKSGGYTLVLVGGVGLLVIILIFLNIIPVSMNLFTKYLLIGVMGTLFILFIIMGILSLKSYKNFEIKAVQENTLTKDLKVWCKEHLKKDVIDADVDDMEEELRYFKRTEVMKEMINNQFLNLDEAFLDSFVDDLYPEIFQ